MSKTTKIQWCDHTFNPWIGCTKVNEACDNCYAEVSMPSKMFGVKWGKGENRRLTSESTWGHPFQWDREARREGVRRRVFCGSLCDWLDPEVPAAWLADLLKMIFVTEDLDWLLLTKRPHLWRKRISDAVEMMYDEAIPVRPWAAEWINGAAPKNVWIGWSAGTQKTFDAAAEEGFKIPARIRFVSAEPLLEEIDASRWLWENDAQDGMPPRRGLDWLIVGGESGPRARDCSIDWIGELVRQCRDAGTACFVKQLGAGCYRPENDSYPDFYFPFHDKKGGDPDEWPSGLRVREFPE